MDLASGYSDSINYGNGYTPLATGAINNNNAAYAQQQAAMAAYAQAMQNNVFASGGGFGQQTADYAGAGAAYGRATGGFGGLAQTPGGGVDPNDPGNIAEYYRVMSGGYGQPGGYTPQQPSYDDSAGLNPSTAPNGGAQPYGGQLPWFWQSVRDWTGMGAAQPTPQPQQQPTYSGWGIGSDAGQSPGQYQNQDPVVDWQKWATQTTAPGGISNQQANPWATSPGYDYNNPASYAGLPAGGYQPMGNPSAQRLLGYDPRGGDGAYTPAFTAGGGLDPNNAGNIAEYYRLMGGGTQTPAQYGGPDTNLYGYPSSGSLGTGTAFGGYQPDTPLGQGGIGSDTSRDRMAWTLAQSSPWATPGAPANGPYPNLGYNPAMANSFANPAMQQYDWTANNANMIKQMEDALKTIDGATGNQPAPPYGGELPPFWQGARDFFGMGAPQPYLNDTWTNRS